jgi:L-2,4-diaminobutyrate decarboxylase
MVLAALGEQGLAEHIERQMELAVEAFEYIHPLTEFECPVRPQSNILCFRIEGSDHLQLLIRNRLIADGEFYISTTSFNGIRFLRLALMNPNTKLEHIKKLVQRVREIRDSIVSLP